MSTTIVRAVMMKKMRSIIKKCSKDISNWVLAVRAGCLTTIFSNC